MSFRHKILKLKIVRLLSSVKLTVLCLFLLYLLTLSGTVAQIQDGLYLAQERYFESFFFLVFGFIPFPGAQLVMWVLFCNLLVVALTRFVYKWDRVGITIIHSGLFLFLISGYVTLHLGQESHLTLQEGQAANVSVAYHDWELAVWQPQVQKDPLITENDITAIDVEYLNSGRSINLNDLGFKLTVKEFYKNCESYTGGDGDKPLSVMGLTRLEPIPLFKEPEKNMPGGILTMETSPNQHFDVLLFGGASQPVTFEVDGKKYNIVIRLKHYPLPFTLKLKDFKKEDHPGTSMARSFQSRVEIQIDKVWREKLISMNEPLRYKDFTLYQASFSIDQMGGETSTLAVVKNAGRLMPYISTFVTFLGLVTHFGMMAFRRRSPKRKEPNDT